MDAATTPVAHIVGPEQVRPVLGSVGNPMWLALDGAHTGGRLTAYTAEVAPGEGPPHHWHEQQDEAWYLIDGGLRFRFDDELHDAPAGAWAYAPRGTPHCFQNVGIEPVRMLVIFTPAGIEPFFEAFADVPDGPDRAARFVALGEPFGMHIVGPPLAISHPT